MHSSEYSTQPMLTNMKGSSYVADTHKFSFSPLNNSNHSSLIPFSHSKVTMKLPLVAKVKASISWPNQKGSKRGFAVGCVKWELLERELEAEMKSTQEGDDEEKGIRRFRDECGERKGVVELLECLEKEAIMGEDMGKEPMDYNRRAKIFDRSSRVFQALKESNDHVHDFPQHSP